jgi:TPR repeat protein
MAAANAESAILRGGDNAEKLFRLGMMYSTGNTVPADMVAAHKWFNIAAARGNREAVRLRREIAEEMSEAEIAAAQRAARVWLTRH